MTVNSETEFARNSLFQTLVKFALTGGLATVLHYFVLAICVYSLSTRAAIGTTLGYIAGAVFGYIMNYTFTFKSDASHRMAILSYLVMVTLGLALNACLVWLCADKAELPLWLVQVSATGLVFIFNFFVSRYWVFK